MAAKKDKAPELTQEQIDDAKKNGNVITVINTKPMTLQEKSRIEKLLNSRADSVTRYLDEMKSFSMEANENTTFSALERENKLKEDKGMLKIEHEELEARRDNEVENVSEVIEEEKRRKIKKLDQIQERITQKAAATKRAAVEQIDKKYLAKREALTKKTSTILAELKELESLSRREKLARKVALASSFRALEDGISDALNHAAERLYTEVTLPHEAKEVLKEIPDALRFRDKVSPEYLFGVFNQAAARIGLPVDQVKCSKCGSDDLMENSRSGYVYCRDCGTQDAMSSEIKKLVLLPSIADIVESADPPQTLNEPQPETPAEASTEEPAKVG